MASAAVATNQRKKALCIYTSTLLMAKHKTTALSDSKPFAPLPWPSSQAAQGLSLLAAHSGAGLCWCIWTPEGQQHSLLAQPGCLGCSLAKADEVMENSSQVLVCQNEAESPRQLGLTEDIIHSPSSPWERNPEAQHKPGQLLST